MMYGVRKLELGRRSHRRAAEWYLFCGIEGGTAGALLGSRLGCVQRWFRSWKCLEGSQVLRIGRELAIGIWVGLM